MVQQLGIFAPLEENQSSVLSTPIRWFTASSSSSRESNTLSGLCEAPICACIHQCSQLKLKSFFFFQDRVSLYSTGYSGTHRDQPASASQVLALNVCIHHHAWPLSFFLRQSLTLYSRLESLCGPESQDQMPGNFIFSPSHRTSYM